MRWAALGLILLLAATPLLAQSRGACPPNPIACNELAERGRLFTCEDGTGLYLCGPVSWIELKNTTSTAPTTTLGAFSLDNLILGTAGASNVIQFNGTNWIPSTLTGAGIVSGTGTNNMIVRWAGTGVPTIQDSVVALAGDGSITNVNNLEVNGSLTVGDGAGGDKISFADQTIAPICTAFVRHVYWDTSSLYLCKEGTVVDLGTPGGGSGLVHGEVMARVSLGF